MESSKPAVPVQTKVTALLFRAITFCQPKPWPLGAMATDPRTRTGVQDNGQKAEVDKVGVRGGGKRVLLDRRPRGDIADTDFKVVIEPVPEPAEGEALVQSVLISLDPTHRLWASETPQYMPCVGLGTAMRAGSIGKVVKSTTGKFKPGTLVVALGGVQEYFCVKESELNPVLDGVPLTHNMSLFGFIGLTAWVGVNICEPKAGQTLVVSGAAGAVGSIAAQLGKARGMRVVGIAGSEDKVQWLKDTLKLDDVINYKAEKVADGLDRCCPNGIDAYFDNVGGETLEAVLTRMNAFGRIAYCGHIAGYNKGECDAVTVNQFQMILMRRIKIQGFIVSDHLSSIVACMSELLDLYIAGKMMVKEDIDESGIENYPKVLRKLYNGTNTGKLIMKVHPSLN
jgi:NADPH-dependent curcumin reductase CurA